MFNFFRRYYLDFQLEDVFFLNFFQVDFILLKMRILSLNMESLNTLKVHFMSGLMTKLPPFLANTLQVFISLFTCFSHLQSLTITLESLKPAMSRHLPILTANSHIKTTSKSLTLSKRPLLNSLFLLLTAKKF